MWRTTLSRPGTSSRLTVTPSPTRAALNLDALDAAFDAARATRGVALQSVREAAAQGLAGLAIKARITARITAVEDPKTYGLKHYKTDDDRGLLYDLMGNPQATPHLRRSSGRRAISDRRT